MQPAQSPKVNLANCKISPETLRSVPLELMQKYHFVPFDLERERLSIALEDPQDAAQIDHIRLACGYELDCFAASREEIDACLRANLPGFRGGSDLSDLKVGAANLSQGLNDLLEVAAARGASDVHFEPQAQELFVRFRTDGILSTVGKLPKELQPALTARLKVMANMDITEKRLPQDGQFAMTCKGRNIDFRISTLPGKYGEKVVVRVLDKSGFALDLSQLGFEPVMQSVFETLIQKPQGLLLVTGPTGSGKTTTLYSVLNRLKSPLKNVITLEDPIEYELLAGNSQESGITQVQMNPKIGMNFSAGLRASLRQDPDVIMVGEVRDRETAEIAIKAALTGHLVLSTLHTNDSFSTLLRLKDMGVEPYLVGATVIGVLAQRLVRVICPACREPYKLPSRSLKILFPKAETAARELTLYRAKGCERCQFTGYHGRKGIFELLVMTEELKAEIAAGSANGGVWKRPAELKSLRAAGLELVRQGITTAEEVFRTTAE